MKNSPVDTIELQNSLKNLLHEIGWDIPTLALKLCSHAKFNPELIDDDGDDTQNEKYEQNKRDKIRKQLSRQTTNPHILRKYINFIVNHREIKDKKYILLPSPDLSIFNDEEKQILNEISKISSEFFNKPHL